MALQAYTNNLAQITEKYFPVLEAKNKKEQVVNLLKLIPHAAAFSLHQIAKLIDAVAAKAIAFGKHPIVETQNGLSAAKNYANGAYQAAKAKVVALKEKLTISFPLNTNKPLI